MTSHTSKVAALLLASSTLAGCKAEKTRDTSTAGQTPGSAASATFDGVGRARIGEPASQLREVGAVPDAGADASCRVVALDWLPPGLHVMLISDTVARIDADSTSAVRTVDGAGIGDTEARIHQLYANVTTQPHKYVTNGHYLSVASPNDSTRRIVFETDGNTVTRYRVGRQPEVDFVEGCG
jgi:hypothetical protein